MDTTVSKWASGTSYGPILSQTDLYLLNTELLLNPILEGKVANHHLQFQLVTGFTMSTPAGGEPILFGKDEPATLPRVNQLIVISTFSPWCTIIKKDVGVTIGDVCSAIYKDYTDYDITDAEFASLIPRLQEHVKRKAAQNFNLIQPQSAQGGWGYYPTAGPDRLRRVDWLLDKVYFEGLKRDDSYAKTRLGFRAPNVFIMDLVS